MLERTANVENGSIDQYKATVEVSFPVREGERQSDG